MSAQKQQLLFGDIDSVPHKWNSVHFSSLTVEHPTPQGLFDQFDREFHFVLDVAADDLNHKCAKYFTKDDNALIQDWLKASEGKPIWGNPPYDRKLGRWLGKAYSESLRGCTIVYLLPVRSDNLWFHKYVTKAADVRFIQGRVIFEGSEHGAPFPSMIVVFRPNQNL